MYNEISNLSLNTTWCPSWTTSEEVSPAPKGTYSTPQCLYIEITWSSSKVDFHLISSSIFLILPCEGERTRRKVENKEKKPTKTSRVRFPSHMWRDSYCKSEDSWDQVRDFYGIVWVFYGEEKRWTKRGTFFGRGDAQASFSKNLGSKAFRKRLLYIFFCIYIQNKHPKYQISCRRHENMHTFT